MQFTKCFTGSNQQLNLSDYANKTTIINNNNYTNKTIFFEHLHFDR